jgi:midasin (ATPase involved in ribosome maturation)
MNRNAKLFIEAAETLFGAGAILNRSQVQRVVSEKGVPYPSWLVSRPMYRYARGEYRLPSYDGPKTAKVNEAQDGSMTVSVTAHDGPMTVPQVAPMTVPMTAEMQPAMIATVHQLRSPKLMDESKPVVPAKVEGYVPFGFFSDLQKIINHGLFHPVFITGLSGNGKTMMVEQVCSRLNREVVRVNISPETDKADLIGSSTMIDGNVVWRDGPVLIAMKRGAVLLLDEVDRGTDKLLCLQAVLEGSTYFNEKTGETITPAKGFTVIATANTKGRGADDGKYLSRILDDAFLERFRNCVEQEYPEPKTERKILSKHLDDENFIEKLVQWADVVRKTYEEGGCDEVISTRRLVHIAETYNIFKDKLHAIKLCTNRFDEDTKTAFMDLYTKVDSSVVLNANNTDPTVVSTQQEPF